MLAIPLYSNLRAFSAEWKTFRASNDRFPQSSLARLNAEVQPFRSYLVSQPITGFVSDLSPDDGNFGVDYSQLQYAIAPLLISTSDRSKFSVAIFHNGDKAAQLIRRESFRVIGSYPDGLTLLEHTN